MSSASVARRNERGPAAALAVLLGGALSLLFGTAVVGLTREGLHVNCSWNIGGERGVDGSWVCADGVGYLGVVVVLGGMSGVLAIAGLILATPKPSRGRSVALLALAAISLVWVTWWTAYAATLYTGPRPEGETGWSLWAVMVLPAISLCTIGLVVGALGAFTGRRWSAVALWGGVGLMIAATVLQLGIGIASFVSAGLLVAAGVTHARAR